MTSSNDGIVLAGDIGGTKTDLGLFRLEGSRPTAVVEQSYPSSEYRLFRDVVEQFLADHPSEVHSVCVGIAGPVQGGRTKATNLPWEVSEDELTERFSWERVKLINDLAATAHAIRVLDESEFAVLNEGVGDPNGVIGLVAPGTGLGMSLTAFCDGTPVVLSSEGGHVEFGPRDEDETDLLHYMFRHYDHVSVERLASGPGLQAIYQWLKESRDHNEPSWLTDLLETQDPSKVISETALGGKDALCREALDRFIAIIGAAAGNLALTGLTSGGMYLGGGIPPKILPRLKDGPFLEAFCAKGRFRQLLSRMPVKVILNSKAAILGAARVAFDL